jgi:hypothetical protein
MTNSFGKLLMDLRDRWRWVRGRCPLCNRNLYAVFPSYMADYPNCPVCTNETKNDLLMWHKHRALGPLKVPVFAVVKVNTDTGESHVKPFESRRV